MATGLNNIHSQREFIKRLTEAIAWCRDVGSLSQPGTSLRTCKIAQADLTSQRHQVSIVCLERSRRLSSSGKRDLSPVADLCGGRLLAYFPDDNLFCGTAEAESQGFFDVDNIPPYDTWVWMVRNIRAFLCGWRPRRNRCELPSRLDTAGFCPTGKRWRRRKSGSMHPVARHAR
jgi:hypothetical protein